MLIEVLPPVLVIHRSLYDRADGGVVKTGKPVQFRPDLGIPPVTTSLFLSHYGQPILTIHRGFAGQDITAPIAQKSTGAQLGSYTLYGVLYHYGVSGRGGAIQLTCSTRMEMVVMEIAFTSTMKL
jgi:hypothetical protein